MLLASALALLAGALAWPADALLMRLRSVSAPTSRIVDRHGVLLYEIVDPQGGLYHHIQLNDVPLALRQAVIATEDAAFYSNPGFSPRGLVRAWLQNMRAGRIVSGASTITQQVARQTLLGEGRHERSLVRKLHEIWLAVRLTATLSKDDILTLYLNETYFGNLAYGVEAASQSYFGKPARELSLAECALLAGLPQAPAAYNPVTHPDRARERQRTVLRLMQEQGYIDAATAERAAHEPLYLGGTPYSIRAPHASVMVRDELAALVGEDAVVRGGLLVETTMDWGLQERVEAIVSAHLAQLQIPTESAPPRRVENAAVVALDHQGAVRALVGSPDYWDASRSGAVNGATALRQPGSALKPFTYAAAFERGLAPASPVGDVPSSFRTAEGESYRPVNYDGRYHGLVSMRDALAGSYNVAAVQVLNALGVQALPEMAQRLGIDTLGDPARHGLALTLGGAEVRLYDLTAAYAGLAAGGQRIVPHLIERVTTSQGEVLYQHPAAIPQQVLDPRVAALVTDVLADDEARASAFGRTGALNLPWPAAVKTGTTNMWRDNWTIGYTESWTVGVWVGNADGSPMEGATGVTGAAPIWNAVMRAAHQSRPAPFAMPPGMSAVQVCALSGELPTEACTHRRVDWFLDEHLPTATCGLHRLVTLDAATGEPATERTPLDRRVVRPHVVWPANVLQWAIDSGLASAEAAQPEAGGSLSQTASSPLRLATPQDGARYHLSATLPHEHQQLRVVAECELAEAGGRLSLEVDGSIWQQWSQPPYTAYWQLDEGSHDFRLIYRSASGVEWSSESVSITVLADTEGEATR
ncbi:MAG: penicillin-binding protein 1C [Anaerolineae bacterium]